MKKNYPLLLALTVVFTAALLFVVSVTQAQNISTIAGTGTAAFSGEGVAATGAELNKPAHVILDPTGTILYISDHDNNRIRCISATGIITTVAGTGTAGFGGDGGPATAATLNKPNGLAFDNAGNLYFSDENNNRIRKIDVAGTITTVAGKGTAGYSGDGGAATAAELNHPNGIAIDPLDATPSIYFTEGANHVVRYINASGKISTIAGTHVSGFSGDGGSSLSAQLNYPYDVALDAGGAHLYIADAGNNRVRKLTGLTISTIAGTGTGAYFGDGGAATAAMLNYPATVMADAYGNVYIGDGANNRIRKINAAGIISTVAGGPVGGFGGDGGLAVLAALSTPGGQAKDAAGNLYIADAGNHRIRKVTPTPLSISGGGTVCAGTTTTLTGTPSGGTWTSSNPGVASIGSSSGISTPVAAGTTVITYTESGLTATSTLTVNAAPAAITGTMSTCIGATTLLSNTDAGGTWSSSDAAIATVDATGNVTGVASGTATVTYTGTTGCYVTSALTVTVCADAAVSDVKGQTPALNVYPNPTAGNVNLELPAATGTITITDHLGRVVIKKESNGTAAQVLSLATGNIPAGNYIIRTYTATTVYTNQLTVVK